MFSAAELAEHFPSFLWVLRDFALQLEDEQQRPITSRQYLEHVRSTVLQYCNAF